MANFKVKSLQTLAFMSLIFDLVSKVLDVIAGSSNRSETVRTVRQYLVDLFKDTEAPFVSEIRQAMVNEFKNRSEDGCDHQVSLFFLDCVLDESVTEVSVPPFLKITAADWQVEEGSSILVNIVNIVADLSPKVDNFYLLDCQKHLMVVKNGPSFSRAFSQFGSLTQLVIQRAPFTTSDSLDFFINIGISCPKLICLKVKNIVMETQEIIGLVLGPKAVEFLRRTPVTPADLGTYQFSDRNVTPICSSLQHIQVNNFRSHPRNPPPSMELYQEEEAAAVAFLLRHFSQLQTVRIKNCKPIAARVPLGLAILHRESSQSSRAALTWKLDLEDDGGSLEYSRFSPPSTY